MIEKQRKEQIRALDLLDVIAQLPQLENEDALGPIASPAEKAVISARVFEIDNLEHTTDHHNCPACKALNAALQAEKKNISSLLFSEARMYWTLRRAQSTAIKPGTHERDDAYLEALDHFFGPIRLRDILPGNLRAYQIARQKNEMRVGDAITKPWKRRAVNSTINHELGLLGRILGHCKLWKDLKEYYYPLKVPKWSPREIMSEIEEEAFFRDGTRFPKAQLAYLVACITNNTTASGSEIRWIRLKDVFLRESKKISEVYISEEGVKKENRPRKIALNRTARWAVQELYKRALKLGCCEPNHFLLPFRRKRNNYDPTRPAGKTFLRKSWAALRTATGHPELKPHDLRHHCITRLLENGVDPETVRAIAGHLRPEMTEYYSHQRSRVKYKAVQAIEPTKKLAPKKPPRSVGSENTREALLMRRRV